jgi:hypothetical protein
MDSKKEEKGFDERNLLHRCREKLWNMLAQWL